METRVTRMYTGPDGESHFEEMKVPYKVKGETLQLTELMKATGITFAEVFMDKQPHWHTAPRRQFVISLEGEHEIEVGDGTRLMCRPGDILLAEDTTGRGHNVHLVNNRPYKAAYITLD